MPHEPKVGELPALPTLIHPDFTFKKPKHWTESERLAIRSYAEDHALRTLAAEREARKDEALDAARYRWLRDGGIDRLPYSYQWENAAQVDTMIDAALQAAK